MIDMGLIKMEAIKCDVCNGALEMEAGGRTATCVVCGMRYSVERLQEKLCATQNFEGGINVGNIKISEDAEQLKTLLVKYLDSFDYNNALHIINRILEAAPTDAEANKIYDRLQELKYFEIKNKVLVKYSGTSKEITIPDGVTEIAENAFSVRMSKYGHSEAGVNIEKLVIPNSVTVIGGYSFYRCEKLKEIVWGDSVTEIGELAFGVTAIDTLKLPSSVKKIGDGAFCGCFNLIQAEFTNSITEIPKHLFSESKVKRVILPDTIQKIGEYAFRRSGIEEIIIPASVSEIGRAAFSSCANLKNVTILNDNLKYEASEVFSGTPYIREVNQRLNELKQKEEAERERVRRAEEAEREKRRQEEEHQEDLRRKAARRQKGVCQYCGGTFNGLFTKKCSNCGRVKDY